VRVLYDLVPVIGEVIASHCHAETRQQFVRHCLCGDWDDARAMIEGMLAEPWLLRGYQETRLREFRELIDLTCSPRGMSGHAVDLGSSSWTP
jgi:hypothetical protein